MSETINSKLSPRFSKQFLRKRLSRQKKHSILQYRDGLGIYWENIDWLVKPLQFTLRALGILEQGYRNTVFYETNYVNLLIPALPIEFRGFKILHISDLHLDGLRDHGQALIQNVKNISYDLCVLTGDFRFLTYGPSDNAIIYTRELVNALKGPGPILGTLGNHDFIDIVPELEACGIKMLVNESFIIQRGSARLGIAGVDDSHFYRTADLDKVHQEIDHCDAMILLSHSQELVKKAAKKGFDIYLSGHTHGGQICLPGGVALIKNMPMSRRYLKGLWKYDNMLGYTSRGVGCSTLPVRYNCSPEIVLHQLI